MEFDLQRFLTDMKSELSQDISSLKRELKTDNERLESKVDTCLLTIADHETRVTLIEQVEPTEQEKRLTAMEGAVGRAQRNLRWVVSTIIGAAIAAGFSWLTSFLSGGITK